MTVEVVQAVVRDPANAWCTPPREQWERIREDNRVLCSRWNKLQNYVHDCKISDVRITNGIMLGHPDYARYASVPLEPEWEGIKRRVQNGEVFETVCYERNRVHHRKSPVNPDAYHPLAESAAAPDNETDPSSMEVQEQAGADQQSPCPLQESTHQFDDTEHEANSDSDDGSTHSGDSVGTVLQSPIGLLRNTRVDSAGSPDSEESLDEGILDVSDHEGAAQDTEEDMEVAPPDTEDDSVVVSTSEREEREFTD